MLPKNTVASKSSPPRPSTECLKQKHLLELTMPSPAFTPEAEHLSDVSSCCSMENTDSNQSSGPDSPINSVTDDSSSTAALDLKRKCKKQLGSAFCSDYHYLMDEQIIDSCTVGANYYSSYNSNCYYFMLICLCVLATWVFKQFVSLAYNEIFCILTELFVWWSAMLL